jgi:hypothetical protein
MHKTRIIAVLLITALLILGACTPAPTSSPTPAPIPTITPLIPTMVDYSIGVEQGQAILSRPKGKGPFPAVVYNHGKIIDKEGYQGAMELGYNLDGILSQTYRVNVYRPTLRDR